MLGRRLTGRLSVSVSPTFAIRWLLPRLQEFNARHPHIEVSVDATHRQIEFPRDGIDLAIRLGCGNWPELYATCLIRKHLVPVCAPTLASTLHTPQDLANATQLHVVDLTDDWEVWSDLAGVSLLLPSRRLRFDTIHLAIEVAAGGLGVAIGRLPLIDTDVAAGRVVPLLGPPVKCATGYWLVAGRESLRRPEVAAFNDWIRDELGKKIVPIRTMLPAAPKTIADDKHTLPAHV